MKRILLACVVYATRIEMDERPKGQSPFEGQPSNVNFIAYQGNEGFSTRLSVVRSHYSAKDDHRRFREPPETPTLWQRFVEPLGVGAET
jgi:hypothetical protein